MEVPDLRSADNRTLLDLRRQNAHLLALVGSGAAIQVQWTVEDDFRTALESYASRKSDGPPWCRRACAVRRTYYDRRLAEGTLRREKVHVYAGAAGVADSAGRTSDRLSPATFPAAGGHRPRRAASHALDGAPAWAVVALGQRRPRDTPAQVP